MKYWMPIVLMVATTGCAANIGGLAEAADDPKNDTAADALIPDIGSVFETDGPDAGDLDAPSDTGSPPDTLGSDATAPKTDAVPPIDTGAGDPPGVMRCGPAATVCDRRGTGNECCLIEGSRRCVGPDDPVPGDLCPAPAFCDDGADCRRSGDTIHTHCCVAENGASQCRSVCGPTETDAL